MFEELRVSHEYPSKSQFFMDKSLDKSPFFMVKFQFSLGFP